MSPEKVETLVLVIGSAVMLLVCFIALFRQQGRLEDPEDLSTVYLDQLFDIVMLNGVQPFETTVYRQSGNIHKHYICGSAEEALKKAVSTFRRARIEYVVVDSNCESFLSFRRGFHDLGGRSAGRKIASIEIMRVSI